MTESNTPPENQKKKSAFSRFFSRKKAPKTEPSTESQKTTVETDQLNTERQTIQHEDLTSVETNDNASNDQKVSSSESLSAIEPTMVSAQSVPLEQHQPIVEPTLQKPILEEKTSINEEPSANQKPLANEESSADRKPLANEISLTQKESLDTQELLNEGSSSKDEATPVSQEPSANQESSTNQKSSTNQELLNKQEATEGLDSSPDDKTSATETDSSTASVEQGLNKSRTSFFQKISNVFKGSFNLDDELFDELEELLITSDIGIDASLNLVEKLRTRVKKEKIQDANGVVMGLRSEITQMLLQSEQEWQFAQKPYVILMVGINGAGKTTTTAKIAKHFQDQGKSVMLAAADTFRAAAVEQLQEWGKRLDIPVIAQSHGADAAAVAHDALTSAIARKVDILMIDTAGRLHTQSDLMEQLTKVNRVLAKIDPSTPHEVMQVLDAGTGQNALTQLEHFQKAVGVSSICLSKLDGSAKGGIAISLSEKTKLPIRFIGTGEGFNDLQRFSAQEFADALVPSLK